MDTQLKTLYFVSGSTSTKLVFALHGGYRERVEDTNGIAVAANALELNSGTIKSLSGSVNAEPESHRR